MCWCYSPRSKKGLLDYKSAHSKLIKRGIALSCLGAALKKSCRHTLSESFGTQVQRLRAAGFPPALLSDVASALLKRTKGSQADKPSVEKKRPVVIPYIHKISHSLKKVGSRYNIPVVFSAPLRLKQVCSRIEVRAEGHPKRECRKKHAKPFVRCCEGVVYKIPLSCNKCYVGQTGRCLNDRLREHNYSLSATVGGHLSLHCNVCKCKPSFPDTAVLGRNKDSLAREVLEAFHIVTLGDRCVSEASKTLSQK